MIYLSIYLSLPLTNLYIYINLHYIYPSIYLSIPLTNHLGGRAAPETAPARQAALYIHVYMDIQKYNICIYIYIPLTHHWDGRTARETAPAVWAALHISIYTSVCIPIISISVSISMAYTFDESLGRPRGTRNGTRSMGSAIFIYTYVCINIIYKHIHNIPLTNNQGSRAAPEAAPAVRAALYMSICISISLSIPSLSRSIYTVDESLGRPRGTRNGTRWMER